MKLSLIHTSLACAAAVVLFIAGCSSKNDPISEAEKGEKNRPGIAETKAIAEEGFIYGLPIVMNYAVMYEFCVDKDSGQYKGPFNQIFNEARVFTYKDTGPQWSNLSGDATLLAEERGPIDPAARGGHMESSSGRAGEVNKSASCRPFLVEPENATLRRSRARHPTCVLYRPCWRLHWAGTAFSSDSTSMPISWPSH
jgi:hypothetical protein